MKGDTKNLSTKFRYATRTSPSLLFNIIFAPPPSTLFLFSLLIISAVCESWQRQRRQKIGCVANAMVLLGSFMNKGMYPFLYMIRTNKTTWNETTIFILYCSYRTACTRWGLSSLSARERPLVYNWSFATPQTVSSSLLLYPLQFFCFDIILFLSFMNNSCCQLSKRVGVEVIRQLKP